MEEKTILIDRLKVNFKMAGSGPAVLILHGWGGSSDSWVKVQEILASRGYQVICPDFPGFGKSQPSLQVWGVEEYVNWTKNFINSQGLEDLVLLGHSFGGRIAICLAKDLNIDKLILCDSAGIKHPADLKTRIILHLSKTGNMILGPRFLNRFKDGARNIFYMFLRRKDYVKAKGIMRENLKKVLETDLRPYLKDIKSKTLIVWGKEDKMVPLKDAYIMKDEIKDSGLKIISGSGHSPHISFPLVLSEILLDFLKT